MHPFYTLLRIALGTEDHLDHILTDNEWDRVLSVAKKHSLTGVCYYALSKIPEEQYPKTAVLEKWLTEGAGLAIMNDRLNKESEALSKYFSELGYRSVILKGQGNISFYPDKDMRKPGDVDVWVDAQMKDLVALARKNNPECRVFYHHVDFKTPLSRNVEIHFRPSWMFNPFINRKLQSYFSEMKEAQMGNITEIGGYKFAVPSPEFNLVYHMCHIYRHVFSEGIGLRQVMDYAFLLQSVRDDKTRERAVMVLRSIHLERFASALMYVIKTVFDLSDDILLLPADERLGKRLRSSILKGGDFGRYKRNFKKNMTSSTLRRFIFHNLNSLSLIFSYPSEAIWAPGFRIWQYFWEKQWR